MNLAYRIIFNRQVRNWLRKPWCLMFILLICSGWLRGLLLGELTSIATRKCKDLLLSFLDSYSFASHLVGLIFFVLSLVATFSIIWIISRIVIDLPGYTKALFWGIMRSYEHNLSKAEAKILIGLPAFISVGVFATGNTSLSACLLAGISLAFHSSSYNLKRLRSRTDEIMKTRSHLGVITPPDFVEQSNNELY